MSDLDLTVDFTDVQQASRALDGLSDDWAKMVGRIVTENRRLDRANKQSSDIQQQAFSRVNTAQVERDLARTSARVDQLSRAYKPLYAASMEYERQVNEISEAHRLGVLSSNQFDDALERVRMQYQAMNNGIHIAGSRFNQFGEVSRMAGRNLNRFGMYSQQVGYQVGDFLVQVQSGTNALVAFSQQGAQLAGLLPGLTGAVIGIGLVLGSSLAYGLMRSRNQAEELQYSISDLKDTDDIFKSVGQSITDNLTTNINNARTAFGDFVSDVAQFRVESFIGDLQTDISGQLEDTSISFSTYSNASPLVAAQAAEDNRRQNELMTQARDIMMGVSGSTTEQISQSFADAYNRVKEIPGITQEILDIVISIGEENGINAEILSSEVSQYTTMVDRIREGAAARSEYNERLREANDYFVDSLNSLNAEAQIQYLINQYGEDSLEVRRRRNDLEAQALVTKAREADLNSAQIVELLDQLQTVQELRDAYEDATAVVEWLAENLGIALSTAQAIAAVDVGNGIRAAASAAAGLAANLRTALGVANALADRIPALSALRGGVAAAGGFLGDAGGAIGGVLNTGADGALDNLLEVWNRSSNNRTTQAELEDFLSEQWGEDGAGGGRGKKGGGSGGGADRPDFVEKLQEEIKRRQELLGLFGEEKSLREEIWRIEDGLGDDRSNYTDAFIENLAEQNLALQEQERLYEEAIRQQQQLADFIENNLTNGLMSIVDGTKNVEDAFREMARNIIKELYEVFVMQRLIGSFNATTGAGTGLMGWLGGLIPSANGTAWDRGVQMFANGGVVNAPTMFAHSGGMGVMGEAGPEAIMPLKRGANGKLGVQMESGGESVIVNQYFNISANGDESVKSIVRGEMPKMTKAAIQAVSDKRARGGSFAKRFK